MLKQDLIFMMITTKIFMQLHTMGQVKLILRTTFFFGEISDKNNGNCRFCLFYRQLCSTQICG